MKSVNGVQVGDTLEEILTREHTALLVVDVKNDLVCSDGWFAQNGKDASHIQRVLPAIIELVALTRSTGVPILFIEQTTLPKRRSDSPAWLHFTTKDRCLRTDHNLDGSWGQQPVDDLDVRPDEIRVCKLRQSAFLGTSLDAMLRAQCIASVLICRTVTHGCVQATTTDASFHDYYAVLTEDGVGSTSEVLHHNALAFRQSRYEVTNVPALRKPWSDNRSATRGNI